MYYSKEQLESYSPKLRALLFKQDHMDSVDRKTPEHEPVLYKIIQVSREEKEVFVYMSVMMDAMYFLSWFDAMKAIRCAELFLREGSRLMEEGLSTERYPDTVMENYMGVLSYIGEHYMGFYQITDEKMEHYFGIYKKSMSSYGHEWRYYNTRLKWELLSRNKKGATAAYKRFISFPITRGMCYICLMEPVVWYHLSMDDFEQAMAQCRDFIEGNIPKEYRGRYETCESANSYRQHMKVCGECVEHEKGEMLPHVLPLIYRELQEFPDDFEVDCNEALVFALYDDFVHWNNHMKEAVWEIDERKRSSPYDYMYACLKWMVYLERLYRSGATWAEFITKEPLPLTADEAGQYRVSELAGYFERMADEIGEKFDKSRKGFSYGKRKGFFKELSKGKGRSLTCIM